MSVTERCSPFSLCIRYTTSAAPLDARNISLEAGRRLGRDTDIHSEGGAVSGALSIVVGTSMYVRPPTRKRCLGRGIGASYRNTAVVLYVLHVTYHGGAVWCLHSVLPWLRRHCRNWRCTRKSKLLQQVYSNDTVVRRKSPRVME